MSRSLSFAIVILMAGCSDLWQPPRDYLSPTWAVYIHNHPKGTWAEKTALDQIIPFRKQPALAQIIIENLLNQYADGPIYIEYADSLFHQKKYSDAIKAYDIDLNLKTPEPEMALYKIAASDAYLGRDSDAVSYLRFAIEMGFHGRQYMIRDVAFTRLASRADFRSLVAIPANVVSDMRGIPPIIQFQSAERVGSYMVALCANGKAFGIDYFTSTGTWDRRGDILTIRWAEYCNVDQQGENKNLLCSDKPLHDAEFMMGGPSREHGLRISQVNKDLQDGEVGGHGMPGSFFGRSGDTAQICAPNFRIKKIEDLDAVREVFTR